MRVHGSCQANRSLSLLVINQSVIDFWESQIKGLYLLSQGEGTYFFKVHLQGLD
jgi:hypothetical protein